MMNGQGSLLSKLSFWTSRRLPIIQQSESAECGLTCLAMIATYHGYKTNLLDLRAKFSLSMRGATLHNIMNFAEELKFSTRPLKLPLDSLSNLQTPCILHWNLNHFVVLKKASHDNIVIHDPAYGIKKLSLADASNHFTGVALELQPTSDFEKKETKPQLKLSDLWEKITGLKRSLTIVFLLSLLLQVFVLAAPYYMQLVVDDVLVSADRSLLTVLSLGFLLILFFEICVTGLRSLTLLHFGNTLSVQLGANLFHHMVRLPLNYYEKRHMGDVVSRFGSLGQVKQILTTGITEAIIDGIMAVITLAMMLFYSIKLSIVVLTAAFLYALIRRLTYPTFRNINKQVITTKAEENSNFMETVRGIQTIKLFGAEIKRESIWQNKYVDSINQNIRLGNLTIGYTAINRLLFGVENILVVYLAASLVLDGGFSVGMLFAFMAYKGQFMGKISGLIEKYIEFKMLGLHLERMSDIALTKKETLSHDNLQNSEVEGAISVQNVYYRYSDATPYILENFSLDIANGESVAITGPSGCGKSTLMKLLLGLDFPEKGEILIDGIPLEKIGNRQYRRQIAAVMQDDQLLSGSIVDNITFFDNEFNMEQVMECARMASIHDDISKMPMTYHSLIGDMGSSLSGGQKQRLLLARALYRKPKILFMDEATSHLDTDLELTITKAVQELKMTRVIVAHRTETILSADRVIKL